ncbi:hypothetical protein PoB_004586600 [Plakobranchus ocellatus]|uniref:Uncharacterized protein n=1 Tax=Plakobranchus ocellatus TaxID=259542 RepID=A0AAV4B7K1_9GAST|nr:hypothetical protein PoB_004586600 [Plakobranchus ocellatus]
MTLKSVWRENHSGVLHRQSWDSQPRTTQHNTALASQNEITNKLNWTKTPRNYIHTNSLQQTHYALTYASNLLCLCSLFVLGFKALPNLIHPALIRTHSH